MSREITEVTVEEKHGQRTESHESWIKLTASRVSSTPGARLFDSEISHQHYVSVRIHRCERHRDLNHDWTFLSKPIVEFSMSNAQWGAFVSSFGDGGGVPATLDWFDGKPVPSAPAESRLAESHQEVLDAGKKSLAQIQKEYDALAEAFESGAGKKAMREKIHNLGFSIGNGPSNMQFAAKSFTEHVENVVTKARADLEGMVTDRALASDTSDIKLLDSGEDENG